MKENIKITYFSLKDFVKVIKADKGNERNLEERYITYLKNNYPDQYKREQQRKDK